MPSITFDNTEIVNGTYVPRYIKHETVPVRELAVMDLTNEDGAILVSERYGVKHITIAGNLKANSRSTLETQIDTLKELFSRKEKNLDIDWAGATRRYVATCIRHEFDRDYMHINFVPWTAEFIVVKGYGIRTTTEELYNGSITQDAFGTGQTIAAAGSLKPSPHSILITISSATEKGKRGFAFKCGDKELIYTQASEINNNYRFIVNCRDKILNMSSDGGANYDEVPFHGEFPVFELTASTFEWTFGEYELEGSWGAGGSYDAFTVYDTRRLAQSFMIPWKDTSIMCLSLQLAVTGSPNNLTVEIQTDDGGVPSGSAVADAVFNVAPGSIAGVATRYKYYFTNPVTLSGNTKYWIVLYTNGGNSSNCWRWLNPGGNWYAKGNKATSEDDGTTWTNVDEDMQFSVYIAGKRTSNSSVAIVITHYPRYL